MDDYLVERVLLAVEQIPPGRVASYGLIAALTETGPRQVGRIMREYGSFVPWWRVTSRDGDFGGTLLDAARPHWDAEGIAVKPNGLGCRYADFVADPADLETAYRAALADNPTDPHRTHVATDPARTQHTDLVTDPAREPHP